MLAKEKTINQDTSVENTEIYPCECGQCIFNSGPKAINKNKDRRFNLWYYNKLTFTYKEIGLDKTVHCSQKFKVDHRCQSEFIKLLGYDLELNLADYGFYSSFIDVLLT